jgi:hypothetical protein
MAATIYEDIFEELIKIFDKVCLLQSLVGIKFDKLFDKGSLQIRVPTFENFGTTADPVIEDSIKTQFIEFNNWIVTLRESIPLPVPLPSGYQDVDRLKVRSLIDQVETTFASIKGLPYRSIDAPKAVAENFRALKALFPQANSAKIAKITAPKLWDKEGNLIDSGTDNDWKIEGSAADQDFKDLENYLNEIYPALTTALREVIDFGTSPPSTGGN